MRRIIVAGIVLVMVLACSLAQAGPPSYLLLKRASTPSAMHPGQGAGVGYAAPAHGYAYGWFGASPRVHPERQMGGYRANIDWRFK